MHAYTTKLYVCMNAYVREPHEHSAVLHENQTSPTYIFRACKDVSLKMYVQYTLIQRERERHIHTHIHICVNTKHLFANALALALAL